MYSCNLKGIMRYSIIKVKMCLIKRKKTMDDFEEFSNRPKHCRQVFPSPLSSLLLNCWITFLKLAPSVHSLIRPLTHS